jgi:RNA polymerase sigma-70 factor (ECF subfamily)
MDRTDWNTQQSSEAERRPASDDFHPEEDGVSGEPAAHPMRDSFEDTGSHLIRNPSRSRPDASLALHGRMSDVMSDALFEQIAVERSEIAFKEFYEYLAPKVYSVIDRIVRSEDDSLDILQEVFTHFWNTAPELYKVHSNISAWILLLARNRAVDETRSYRFRTQHNTESYDTIEHEHLVTETHAADEKLTADAGRLEIQKALEVLTADQKKIMELVFFAGMTMKAVGETLHMTPGAVRKTVHDSVKKLRQVIKPEQALQFQLEKPAKKIEKKGKIVKQPKRVEPTNVEAATTIDKVPKERPEQAIKKTTRAEGQSRRAMKLHSILDDLMKNRQDVLNTPVPNPNPANQTLDTL